MKGDNFMSNRSYLRCEGITRRCVNRLVSTPIALDHGTNVILYRWRNEKTDIMFAFDIDIHLCT